jgi:hypothetical protein
MCWDIAVDIGGEEFPPSIAPLIHEEGLKQHWVRQPLTDHDR